MITMSKIMLELKFSLIIDNVDESCCDEIGEDICYDMMCMHNNGEDVYEWLYRGYDKVDYEFFIGENDEC